MNVIIGIILIAVSISLILYIEIQRKKGNIKKNTYSYFKFLRIYMFGIIIIAAVTGILYFASSSIEFSITIGVFAFFCLTAGIINLLFGQYRIKRRGGKREDQG